MAFRTRVSKVLKPSEQSRGIAKFGSILLLVARTKAFI